MLIVQSQISIFTYLSAAVIDRALLQWTAIKLVIYSANTSQTQIVYSVTADISCSLLNSSQGPQ